jgi:exopolyphosphatase/guanosine-5'-triphosphate,3'-diphosphate pyrophosphatase
LEVGVSVLYRKFHNSEPINNKDKSAINNFLSEQLALLRTELEPYKNIGLLGAAGTFDVIENFGGYKIPGTECTQVNLDDFYSISTIIQKMDLNTRFATPEIPNYRAEMIVVALLLIEQVLKSGDITNICIVMGDIKDGILLDMIA